jgi:hypothetical protein
LGDEFVERKGAEFKMEGALYSKLHLGELTYTKGLL